MCPYEHEHQEERIQSLANSPNFERFIQSVTYGMAIGPSHVSRVYKVYYLENQQFLLPDNWPLTKSPTRAKIKFPESINRIRMQKLLILIHS
jgi:hypothetical protein